jgi:hypothetical protein
MGKVVSVNKLNIPTRQKNVSTDIDMTFYFVREGAFPFEQHLVI